MLNPVGGLQVGGLVQVGVVNVFGDDHALVIGELEDVVVQIDCACQV